MNLKLNRRYRFKDGRSLYYLYYTDFKGTLFYLFGEAMDSDSYIGLTKSEVDEEIEGLDLDKKETT